MLLSDGVNVSRSYQASGEVPQRLPEPREQPLGYVDSGETITALLQDLTVPEVCTAIRDGAITPEEALFYESVEQGGKGRRGVLTFAQDVIDGVDS